MSRIEIRLDILDSVIILGNDLLIFVYSGLLILGLLWTALLILLRKRNRSSILISLFILFYSLGLVNDLIFLPGVSQANAGFLFLPINFYLLHFVIFWFYALNISGRWNFNKYKRHLIPGIIEFGLCTIFFLFPKEVKLSWYESGVLTPYLKVYSILHIGWTFTYCFYTLNIFKKHNDLVCNYFSCTESKTLKWILVAAIYSAILVLITDGFFLFKEMLYPFDLSNILIILNLFYVFCIGLFGFQQLQVFDNEETSTLVGQKSEEIKSKLDENTAKDFHELLAFIEKEKPFLQQDLVLSDLAKALKVKDRILREIIQTNTGMHFNHFINKFRVEETKRLLRSPDFEHYTLQAIGQEAGFQAKTTFFAAFKYFEKITPATYQKLMKKNPE